MAEVGSWLAVARAAWRSLKRPYTALLLASALLLAVLEALWAFRGYLLSIEAVAALVVSVVFFVLAVWIARRRGGPDAWKPFIATGILFVAYLLLFGDLWPFYAFPIICGFVGALLYNREPTHVP